MSLNRETRSNGLLRNPYSSAIRVWRIIMTKIHRSEQRLRVWSPLEGAISGQFLDCLRHPNPTPQQVEYFPGRRVGELGRLPALKFPTGFQVPSRHSVPSFRMTEEMRAQYQEYVDRWKRLGPLLEEQREADVRASDTVSNIAAFGRLWTSAVRDWPPTDTSGLVEQQRFFAALRPA